MVPGATTSCRHDSATLRRAFQLMTWTVSLNHATVTTLMMYATSAVGNVTGNLANALLFSVSLATSLGFAPLIVNSTGPKRGLALGLASCSLYVLFFVLSVFACSGQGGCACDRIAASKFLAFAGAVFGGLGTGLLWPSQGAFFSATVEGLLAERPAAASVPDASEASRFTAELSASFACVLLTTECCVKLTIAVLLTYAKVKVQSSWVFLVALALAAGASLAFTRSPDIGVVSAFARTPMCGRASAAVRLWREPKLWLLSLTNFAFGFSVAWVNGYVNVQWHEAGGDLNFLGFAGALTTGVAGVVSKLSVQPLSCGKGPIIAFGSMCFVTIGVLSRIPDPTEMLGLRVWVVFIHVLHGVGRGVYEGTNKGVFGDFFPGDKAVGAFANVLVQVSSSSIIGYVLESTAAKDVTNTLLLLFAALTLPCYLLAGRLHRARTANEAGSEKDKDLERGPGAG